ncbi:hypothetical protein L218DRAFT_874011 [Marasmius fiardii PR-910]|nr:hypothetical protein L218DRAFT_874011 [Marasmius fiardii PR-910]
MVFNPSNTVAAQVTYVVPPPDGVQAYQLLNLKTGINKENIVRVQHDVVIENIRGKQHLYTLDEAGFQYLHRPTKHTDFDDIKELEEYYRESTEIVKEVTGASRVILYDPLQRRRRAGEEDSDTVKKRRPAGQVHVDVSLSAAFSHIHRYAPTSEASKLLSSRRFQVINLWRPINNPAFDWPVAFCVWDSVDVERDTFSVPRLRPEKYNEALGVRFSCAHRWKYLRGMRTDEVVLIKNFDSDESVARFTPHTAFEDPTTPKGSPPRESIELRFLVFYD